MEMKALITKTKNKEIMNESKILELKEICKAYNLGSLISYTVSVNKFSGFLIANFEAEKGNFNYYFKD